MLRRYHVSYVNDICIKTQLCSLSDVCQGAEAGQGAARGQRGGQPRGRGWQEAGGLLLLSILQGVGEDQDLNFIV